MTGRELIKWILDHEAENLPIEINYRDKLGGYCDGTTDQLYLEIEIGEKINKETGRCWQYQKVVL